MVRDTTLTADAVFDRTSLERYISDEWEVFVKGTRFVCVRCSWCCKRPWTINLTWHEYDRLEADRRAKGLKGVGRMVDPGTGLDHPYFRIKGACPMFREKGSICTLYPDWPYTCATYPFLLMPDGRLLYHRECPGIGRGPAIDEGEMRERILSEREKAGMIVER